MKLHYLELYLQFTFPDFVFSSRLNAGNPTGVDLPRTCVREQIRNVTQNVRDRGD